MLRFLNRFHRSTKSARPAVGARRHPARARLAVEELEDRALPSIAFIPHFTAGRSQPAEATQFGSDNYTSAHQVELIFWGSSWATTNSALMARLQTAAQAVVNSTYLRGAQANYGTAGEEFMDPSHPAGVNPSTQVTRDPGPTIQTGELSAVVHNVSDNNGNHLVPEPDDPSVGPTPIYVMVTPPGITSSDLRGRPPFTSTATPGASITTPAT
jgi:hypothetical protein